MKKLITLLILLLLATNNALAKTEIKKEYYPNGALKTEIPLTNGKENGELRRYQEDGSLLMTINYKMGQRDGKTVLYGPDGYPIMEFSMKNNQLHGTNKTYWQDTHSIKSQSKWENGIQGKSTMYYKNGKKQWTFNNNEIFPSFEFFDKQENLFASGNLEQGFNCYRNNKIYKTVKTSSKIEKLEMILEEMEDALTNPNIDINKEYDFSFLCK